MWREALSWHWRTQPTLDGASSGPWEMNSSAMSRSRPAISLVGGKKRSLLVLEKPLTRHNCVHVEIHSSSHFIPPSIDHQSFINCWQTNASYLPTCTYPPGGKQQLSHLFPGIHSALYYGVHHLPLSSKVKHPTQAAPRTLSSKPPSAVRTTVQE